MKCAIIKWLIYGATDFERAEEKINNWFGEHPSAKISNITQISHRGYLITTIYYE